MLRLERAQVVLNLLNRRTANAIFRTRQKQSVTEYFWCVSNQRLGKFKQDGDEVRDGHFSPTVEVAALLLALSPLFQPGHPIPVWKEIVLHETVALHRAYGPGISCGLSDDGQIEREQFLVRKEEPVADGFHPHSCHPQTFPERSRNAPA